MPAIYDKVSFALEFERKVDELVNWAIANSPDKTTDLTSQDFLAAKELFCNVANRNGDPLKREPEPSEGGAQYVNVSPAPWP